MTAPQNIAALRSSHELLVALVEPLDGDGLRAPSYDSEWTIGQVLSHLGSQAEIMGMYLEAALAGGEGPDRDAFGPVWDEWNQLPPEEHLRRCLAANADQLDRLEALTAEQVDTLQFSLFGGMFETDTAGYVRLRLGEHALHTWDVGVALDPAATVRSDAIEILVDAVPELVARVGQAQGKEFALLVATEAPPRAFALRVDGAVTLAGPIADAGDGGGGGPTDGTLRLPSEALVRLVYGRLDPDHTPAVELTSGQVGLDDVRAVFPGF